MASPSKQTAEYWREYRLRNPHKRRESLYKRYDKLFKWPKGTTQRIVDITPACMLCCGAFIGRGHKRLAPVVDHDHETNRFRGVIHFGCNAALGMLGDNIEGLSLALSYLKFSAYKEQ